MLRTPTMINLEWSLRRNSSSSTIPIRKSLTWRQTPGQVGLLLQIGWNFRNYQTCYSLPMLIKHTWWQSLSKKPRLQEVMEVLKLLLLFLLGEFDMRKEGGTSLVVDVKLNQYLKYFNTLWFELVNPIIFWSYKVYQGFRLNLGKRGEMVTFGSLLTTLRKWVFPRQLGQYLSKIGLRIISKCQIKLRVS